MLNEDCPRIASCYNLSVTWLFSNFIQDLIRRVVCISLCSFLIPISLVKFLPFCRASGFFLILIDYFLKLS